jgi:hypothetical protein
LQWQKNPGQKTLSCSAFVVAPFVVATKNLAAKAGEEEEAAIRWCIHHFKKE